VTSAAILLQRLVPFAAILLQRLVPFAAILLQRLVPSAAILYRSAGSVRPFHPAAGSARLTRAKRLG